MYPWLHDSCLILLICVTVVWSCSGLAESEATPGGGSKTKGSGEDGDGGGEEGGTNPPRGTPVMKTRALPKNNSKPSPGAGWYPIGDDSKSKSWVYLARDKKRMTYDDASKFCKDEKEDSHLLEIYTEEEYVSVRQRMIDSFKDYNEGKPDTYKDWCENLNTEKGGYCDVYWLGANDKDKEMNENGRTLWKKWNNGKDMTFEAWATKSGDRKQPDNTPPNGAKGKKIWETDGEDCLTMTRKEPWKSPGKYESYGWNDMVCDGQVMAKGKVDCCFAACRIDIEEDDKGGSTDETTKKEE